MPFLRPFRYRSRMKSVALLVLLFASACTKKNPEACCTTEADCTSLGLPIGSDCGDGLMCIGNRCVATTTCQAPSDCPSATPQCNPEGTCVECLETSECGNQVCGDSGQCVACIANEECDVGFCSEGTCRTSIIPKYLPSVCDAEAAADLQLPPTVDTNDGTVCTQILSQGVGLPDVCVVHAKTIVTNGTVTVTGSRALALVADREITIAGTIDAAAKLSVPGPGVTTSSGGAASQNAGGGGAGFQTDGADGGLATNAGAATPDPAALPTFSGGVSGTGTGAGAGGGALMLISCRSSVSIAGTIDVGGGGGGAGTTSPLRNGGGGGSGGYIVVQGVVVEVTGAVFANGGGGGSGPATGGVIQAGNPGANGTASSTESAAGGDSLLGNAVGRGGRGGVGTTLPTKGDDGRTQAGNTIGAGGGGGSVGFLQTYTPAGVAPKLETAVTSPPFQPNLELSTK